MVAESLNLGVAGLTEGNGHPYSFASIVNGYSDDGFRDTEWGVINEYLREKDKSEFGFPGVKVTHAWTQDEAETRRLCEAARVPNAVSDIEDFRGAVDAVLLLRGDYENHLEMARPFLEEGTPVFVDKPLTVDVDEVREFRSHLENGRLMSCSGMRFARSLDGPRAHIDSFGDLKLARGTVIKDWEEYGVHMLDAIFGILDHQPVAVEAARAEHASVTIETTDGPLVQIDALGTIPMTFSVDLYGTERVGRYDLRDNFTAFRRTLWRFLEMVRAGEPVLPPEETLNVIRILIAGRRSMNEGRRVELDELDV